VILDNAIYWIFMYKLCWCNVIFILKFILLLRDDISSSIFNVTGVKYNFPTLNSVTLNVSQLFMSSENDISYYVVFLWQCSLQVHIVLFSDGLKISYRFQRLFILPTSCSNFAYPKLQFLKIPIVFLMFHYCCTRGILWHLQKFLQYIIVELTSSIILFILPSPSPGIVSEGLIFPFS
jgi:hypothetical protein